MSVRAWPVRLEAQDTALSRLRQGFDSPTGYHPFRGARSSAGLASLGIIRPRHSTTPTDMQRSSPRLAVAPTSCGVAP